MKPRHILFFLLATLMMGSAHAALVLTDHPEDAGGEDVFYNSLTNVVAGGGPPSSAGTNRFSLDTGDTAEQTITLSSAITLDSIYLGYNDQQSTGNFDLRIDLGDDGSIDHTFTVAVTNALQSGGGNTGPYHYLQFDLSSESISMGSGAHSISLLGGTDNGEGAFLIAPIYFESDTYAGGIYDGNAGRDMLFAVTSVVPEPSAALLVLFAGSALLLRRRRA